MALITGIIVSAFMFHFSSGDSENFPDPNRGIDNDISTGKAVTFHTCRPSDLDSIGYLCHCFDENNRMVYEENRAYELRCQCMYMMKDIFFGPAPDKTLLTHFSIPANTKVLKIRNCNKVTFQQDYLYLRTLKLDGDIEEVSFSKPVSPREMDVIEIAVERDIDLFWTTQLVGYNSHRIRQIVFTKVFINRFNQSLLPNNVRIESLKMEQVKIRGEENTAAKLFGDGVQVANLVLDGCKFRDSGIHSLGIDFEQVQSVEMRKNCLGTLCGDEKCFMAGKSFIMEENEIQCKCPDACPNSYGKVFKQMSACNESILRSTKCTELGIESKTLFDINERGIDFDLPCAKINNQIEIMDLIRTPDETTINLPSSPVSSTPIYIGSALMVVFGIAGIVWLIRLIKRKRKPGKVIYNMQDEDFEDEGEEVEDVEEDK